MANNITTTGGNVATDQVGDGSHVQLMKIVSGTEDSIERIEGTAANGLEVDMTRAPADPFGTNLDAASAVSGAGSMQAKLRLMTSQLDALKTSIDTLLTNTQIRATALPVSGPLTDAQLRATALPIQLDAAALAALESTTATISGTVPVTDGGGSLTVDGPITNTELRAAPVQIGDNGGSLTVDGTVTANVSGTVPVSGPLTDTQLRATGITVVLPTGTNNIGDVDVLTLPALPAGENHIAEVGGNTEIIRLVPTISAGAYSANDVVGGRITLTGAMRKTSGSGVLMSLTVHDLSAVNAALEFYFFDSLPTASTADNGAFAWTSGDEDKFLGMVAVAAADYTARGGDSFATLRNVGLPVKANATANLYCFIVATGTPTWVSTSDLTFSFGFLRD